MLHVIRLVALVSVIAFASIAVAFSTGPPNERTGAPGEGTCADCHGNLNVGDGRIVVQADSPYVPGETVDVTVWVRDPGQIRWGFELTVLDGNNLPVGDLIVTEPTRTQVSVAGNGRQYIKHTALGTDNGTPDESPGWSFQWASPAVDPGSVTFYIAGNAANGNFANTGDFIYTNVYIYDGSHSFLIDDDTTWGMIKALYR